MKQIILFQLRLGYVEDEKLSSLTITNQNGGFSSVKEGVDHFLATMQKVYHIRDPYDVAYYLHELSKATCDDLGEYWELFEDNGWLLTWRADEMFSANPYKMAIVHHVDRYIEDDGEGYFGTLHYDLFDLTLLEQSTEK